MPSASVSEQVLLPDDRRPLAEPREVADYLRRSVRTLAQWRWRGIGPRWVRVHERVRYRWSDVDAWVDEQVEGGVPAA